MIFKFFFLRGGRAPSQSWALRIVLFFSRFTAPMVMTHGLCLLYAAPACSSLNPDQLDWTLNKEEARSDAWVTVLFQSLLWTPKKTLQNNHFEVGPKSKESFLVLWSHKFSSSHVNSIHSTETGMHHLHQRNASWVVVKTSDREISFDHLLLGCRNVLCKESCRHFNFDTSSVCVTSSAVGLTCCQASLLIICCLPSVQPRFPRSLPFWLNSFLFFPRREREREKECRMQASHKGEFLACEAVKCGLF